MRGKLIVISLALAGALTACGGRELTDVTLIQALGVDGPGPVALTAVGDGEAGPEVYRTVGGDVTRAQEGLRDLGTTRLEVTHITQLVLGRDADVAQTLWQAATHRKSGCGAAVWLCGPGQTAAELLTAAEDPSARLSSLEENGGAAAPTVLEALSTLTRDGQVTLPVVKGEGGDLRLAGYETVEGG